MQLLLAKPIQNQLTTQLKARVSSFFSKKNRAPCLAVILVGTHAPSQIYVALKEKRAKELGIESKSFLFPENTEPQEVFRLVQSLNNNPQVDGILIQRPLPPHFKESDVVFWVFPEKDVDAFHPETIGRMSLSLSGFKSCTAWGILRLLDYYGLSVSGKLACIVGRSAIVGKPLAQLLLERDATLIHAHSKTNKLKELTRQSDLIFCATGQPEWLDASWVKTGAVVVDIGITKKRDGKIVGDACFDSLSKVASAITPVPGGVGPMTILSLMENTILSAEKRLG